MNLRKLQLRDIREMSAYTYLLTQFRVIITYIRLLFIPINQHFEYDFPLSNSIFEPATLISFLVLLLIISFAVYLFIRSRKTHHVHGLLFSFGMLWFFITLSIESSIIPIKDVISEHRLYLPSIGFILSMTTAIFYGLKTLDSRLKAKVFSLVSIVLSLFFIITGIFSFAAYKRNVLWGDIFLFYSDEVKKSPNRSAPHYNIGVIYYEEGLVDKAMEHYQSAIKLKPDYPEAHNNLGNVYYNKGLIDMAMEHYQIAIKLTSDYPEAHNNLGSVYSNKGLIDMAMEHYQIAIKLKPDFSDAHNNLGKVYYNKGLIDMAMEHYQIAITLKPNFPDAHNNLGIIYGRLGQLDSAIQEFSIAIRLNPDIADAHYNMGIAYKSKGLVDKAVEHFKIALKLRQNAQDNHIKILEEETILH